MATFKETPIANVLQRTTKNDGTDLVPQIMYQDGLNENCEIQWQPASFKAFTKIMRTTNKDLSITIKNYYAQTFHDLYGVFVMWNGQRWDIQFYFFKNPAPKSAEKIENLIDITTTQKGTGLYALKQAADNKIAGKKYTLNDQTKLLLADICIGGREKAAPTNPNGQKFWQSKIFESFQNTGDIFNPRAGFPVVAVAGCFDIHRILSKLFGRRMVIETTSFTDPENGKVKAQNIASDAKYEARYIRPVINEPHVVVMNIEQFDISQTEMFVQTENPKPIGSSGFVCF